MSDNKVLIVDDDEELHTLYGLYLRGENFDISRALNGEEAFKILASTLPNVIVLDMIMPVMDGETFLLKLQDVDKANEVPVIIASVNDKIPKQLTDLKNVHSVLKKPFTIETLVERIREVISSSQTS